MKKLADAVIGGQRRRMGWRGHYPRRPARVAPGGKKRQGAENPRLLSLRPSEAS
jgi:hypothetical protein